MVVGVLQDEKLSTVRATVKNDIVFVIFCEPFGVQQ